MSTCCSADIVTGVTEGTGVTGVAGFATLLPPRSLSLFFSSDLRKAFTVKRSALFGLQSSAVRGLCAQTGHDSGKDVWPVEVSA